VKRRKPAAAPIDSASDRPAGQSPAGPLLTGGGDSALTIVEIIAHARYHEFAAAVTRSGHQVVPDAFPWRLMGLSDDEILAAPLTFTDGRPMPVAAKGLMIGVVRAQELLVAGWWRWWQSWEWIANGRARARAETKLEPAAWPPTPGCLF